MHKKYPLRFLIYLLIFFYLAFSFIFGDMGLIKYYMMKEKEAKLDAEINRLISETEKLHKEVEALRSDPQFIEGIARDKLGMSRPGEIIYQYEER
ncbi:MAG: septum formation initiator family protein [Nitrospirota bacterium]